MTITLEAGKFYRMRDGRKAGPMTPASPRVSYDFSADVYDHDLPGANGNRFYQIDGRHGSFDVPNNPNFDIVAEWTDKSTAPSPVRTVTRQEIVPGTYGWVTVSPDLADAVVVRLHGPVYSPGAIIAHRMTAADLRAIARTFTELADALDANKEPAK